MGWFKSLIVAFSMYSAIPMPHMKLEEKDMQYSMGFFPLAGLVIGACFYGIHFAAAVFGVSKAAEMLVLAIVPLLVTGGIHVDGYMDTMDALHSYGSREKKLEILKDSHIGAFAVIMLAAYAGGYLAALAQIIFGENEWTSKQIQLLCAVFYLSRIFSAFAAVNLKGARADGMLHTFASTASKSTVNGMLAVQLAVLGGWLVWLDLAAAAGMFLTQILVFLYYRYKAYREFGGVTGDLAGYFLCLSELWMMVFLAVFGLIC